MTVRTWAAQNKFRTAILLTVVGTATLVAGIRVAAGRGEKWPLFVAATPLLAGLWLQHRRHPPGAARAGVVAGVGLALLAAALGFLSRYADGYGFAAVVVAVLAGGHLLTELRLSGRGAPWRGPVVLAGCAASFFGGLTALGGSPRPGALKAVGAGVLLAPIGISLLTEDVLNRYPLSGRDGSSFWRRLRNVPAVAGFAVVLAAYVLVAVGPGTIPVLTGAFVVAFLLMLAIAAANQADIAVVTLVLASFAAIVADPVPLDEPFAADPGERVVVALGDSFISGEGAETYFAGTNEKGSNECRRSPTSYVADLARNGVQVGGTRVDDVVFLACSGAKAHELWDVAQGSDDARTAREPADGAARWRLTQLAHLRRLEALGAFDPALLLVSIGGNDSGFSAIGMACVAPRDCSDLLPQWLAELKATVQPRLAAAYFEISRAVNGRYPVAVVPYPVPLNKTGCDATWLTANEHATLHEFTIKLNDVVEETAKTYGFGYVADMEAALGSDDPAAVGVPKLRLCDDPDLRKVGVNFPGLRTLRSVGGPIEQRLDPRNWLHNNLHPNAVGHDAMAVALRRWLAASPALEPPKPPAPGATRPPVPGPRPADCDAHELTDPECGPDARSRTLRWAADTTVDFGGANVALLLVLLAGLWLLCVGVLRARRATTQPADAGGDDEPPPDGTVVSDVP